MEKGQSLVQLTKPAILWDLETGKALHILRGILTLSGQFSSPRMGKEQYPVPRTRPASFGTLERVMLCKSSGGIGAQSEYISITPDGKGNFRFN